MPALVRTRLLIESADQVKHLHIFDMDGTLAISPGPSQENRDLYRYSTRSRVNPRGEHIEGWWGDHRTLLPPFKAPPIKKTVAGYHAAKASPNSKVIIMTGRVNTPDMQDAVSATLRKLGIRGHKHGVDLFLKPPGRGKKQKIETAAWKGDMLRHFHKTHPHLQHVHMWDDRLAHLQHFDKTLQDLGLARTLRHVDDPRWAHGDMPSTT